MRLEDTYMLVFSLLLIKVNGGGVILYNFFLLQLQLLFLVLSWSY